MKTPFANLRSTLITIRDALALMYRVSPARTITMWALVIMLAAVPTILLVTQRRIVDHLADSLQPTGAELWTVGIIAVVAVFALTNTLSDLGDTLQTTMADHLRDTVAIHTSASLLERVGEWQSLDLHENADRLDQLRLAATGQTGYRNLSWSLFATITGVLAMLPLIVVIATVAWWIPLVVSLSIIPGIWMTMMLPQKEWQEREKLAHDERKRDLYYQMMMFPDYARDVRLFGMMPQRIQAWRQVALPVLLKVTNVRVHLLRQIFVWSLLCGTLVVFPLIWLVNRAAVGTITIGDVVMVIGSLNALRMQVWSVAGNGAQIGEALIGIRRYQTFMDIQPPTLRGEDSSAGLPPLQRALDLQNISFSYPAADQPVLRNHSVTLRAGESVAIVGENGAGKTTLTRLIARLFDVQEGDIRWDDLSIYDVSPSNLRDKLAVIPQDFARFPLSLRENIALGRMHNPPTDAEIEQVLRDVGLEKLLTLNDAPLDTLLTKELDGGTQLSGGQWQRIAIARAMVRAPQADVVIMDEPTAALDPHTEVDIARKMLQVAEGKTAIVISHRLGICTLVDRVLVMEDGRIIEDGRHADLLSAGGHYARMFQAQASWYV